MPALPEAASSHGDDKVCLFLYNYTREDTSTLHTPALPGYLLLLGKLSCHRAGPSAWFLAFFIPLPFTFAYFADPRLIFKLPPAFGQHSCPFLLLLEPITTSPN